MDKIEIIGGKSLCGKVRISGAKNATLPALAATLLAAGRHCVRNVPQLRDVDTMSWLLRGMGVKVEGAPIETRLQGGQALEVDTSRISRLEAPYDLVKTMRASVLVLGPLVARFGTARVSLPGGCAIGARPIDQHLKGLKSLGAEIDLVDGYVLARASRLRGSHISLDLSTVTGTENLMMAATLAEGLTILENAAQEPEVISLAQLLEGMGARISGAGTSIIEIEGVETLRPMDYTVMPDRIEAGTFLVAGAITGGDVEVEGCIPEQLKALTAKLREAGAEIQEGGQDLRIRGDAPFRKGSPCIRPVNIQTAPYPGFPTDMQAQVMALMCLANGTSIITETVFENRFMHVAELRRMGADIEIQGRSATVKGIKKLVGAPVMATDLRASASLILAGLAAEGKTVVDRVYHIDRGYERIEEKLSPLGAHISRIR